MKINHLEMSWTYEDIGENCTLAHVTKKSWINGQEPIQRKRTFKTEKELDSQGRISKERLYEYLNPDGSYDRIDVDNHFYGDDGSHAIYHEIFYRAGLPGNKVRYDKSTGSDRIESYGVLPDTKFGTNGLMMVHKRDGRRRNYAKYGADVVHGTEASRDVHMEIINDNGLNTVYRSYVSKTGLPLMPNADIASYQNLKIRDIWAAEKDDADREDKYKKMECEFYLKELTDSRSFKGIPIELQSVDVHVDYDRKETSINITTSNIFANGTEFGKNLSNFFDDPDFILNKALKLGADCEKFKNFCTAETYHKVAEKAPNVVVTVEELIDDPNKPARSVSLSVNGYDDNLEQVFSYEIYYTALFGDIRISQYEYANGRATHAIVEGIDK